MAMKRNVLGVEEIDCSAGINTEEYNQIDPEILDCFPSSSYPVDLYRWKPEISVLAPIYRAGRTVDRHLRSEAKELSGDGCLFFSRTQINEYADCVSCNLEAALDDPNLTCGDMAGIFVSELGRRQSALFQHTKPWELEALQWAIDSFCRYLSEDMTRTTKIVHDVHRHLSIERRRINSSLLALAVYIERNKDNLNWKHLRLIALGFLLYDIGMSRLSPMMLGKSQQFSTTEKRTMREHPKLGLELVTRLNLCSREVTEPVMQHHERLNGGGYPNKLSDHEIGELGRIAGVADCYCAMITDSPYKKGKEPIDAAAELVTKEKLYDQVICRTLIRFLQTVPSND